MKAGGDFCARGVDRAQQLEQAAGKLPTSATVQDHYGVALAKARLADRGRQALQRALQLNLAAAAADARRLLKQLNS